MIQPTLTAYSVEAPPRPVSLDVKEVKPDRILVLDTFFYIIVFSGSLIAQWRDAGYHEDPKYSNLKALFQAPKDDAAAIIDERFPYAR